MTPELIDEWIAACDTEIAAIAQRRDYLWLLRGTYGGEQVAATPAVAPVVAEEPAKPPAPKSTAKRTTARGKRGRQSVVDWPATVEVIEQARAEGVSVANALVEKFGITHTAARDRLKRAGQQGLVTPGTRGGNQRTTAAPVAKTTKPEPKFAVPENNTFDLPDRPRASPTDDHRLIDKVYRCSCGTEVATENDLNKHTRSEHDRWPVPEERRRVAAA